MIADRSAQRWMRLDRAGFKSAIVADFGFAQCDAWAAASLGMLPNADMATQAWGTDADSSAGGLFLWWRDGAHARYWSSCFVGERGGRHEPRQLLPIWMLSVLHVGERGRYDRYGEKPIPVAEAMQFIAAVGS